MQTQHSKTTKGNQRTRLVHGAWQLLKTLLYTNKTLNEVEVQLAKKQIAELIIEPSFEASKNNFNSFCERVLLVFQYYKKHNHHAIEHPLIWLSPHYPNGYTATEIWYEELLNKRLLMVVYQFEIKIFAVGYYKYLIAPNKQTYLKCQKALMQYADNKLLPVFNNAIVNLHYN
jgi:hypothetical protein